MLKQGAAGGQQIAVGGNKALCDGLHQGRGRIIGHEVATQLGGHEARTLRVT